MSPGLRAYRPLQPLMAQVKDTSENFNAANKTKTYSLVEIVRAPLNMANHGPDNTVFSFPVVAILELVLIVGLTALLVFISLVKNAPLEELANPLITTDPAKAPWYFMGLQELLEHMHPTLAGIMIPSILVLFLVAIPYIDNNRTGAGRWFTDARGKRLFLFTSLYALVVMPLFVILNNMFPPRELLREVLPPLIAQAVIPGVILFGLAFLPAIFLWFTGKGKVDTRELVLVLFTMLMVSALVFTLSGFLFRGPGFKLYMPWDMPNGYNPLDSF